MERNDDKLPTVVGHVSVFNRKKTPLLPYETRNIRLDWSKCDEQELNKIGSLLPARRAPLSDLPMELGSKKIEITVGAPQNYFPLRMFRNKFIYVDLPELTEAFRKIPSPIQLHFDHEYVETEDGQPTNTTDVLGYVTGTPNPLVLGEPETIRRIGPTPARNTAAWHAPTAGVIQQFLTLISHVSQSKWTREPVRITSITSAQGVEETLPSHLPHLHSFTSVAPFLRQLYDRRPTDNLLVRASDIYLYFCSDEGKNIWLRHELDKLKKMLSEPPFASAIKDITVYELFELIMYGSRLLHAQPHSRADKQLNQLVQKYGAKQVAFDAHASFKHFFSRCCLAGYPIHLDFEYWTAQQGLPVEFDELNSQFFGTV